MALKSNSSEDNEDKPNNNGSYFTAFESLPDNYLILSKDFKIITASDAYLKATYTVREEIRGKNIFEVFPDNPGSLWAQSAQNLNNSLQEILKTKVPHEMEVLRYDVPKHAAANGEFEKKYWKPLNTPVLDRFGEVAYIIHKVIDVTELMETSDELEVSRKFLSLQAARLNSVVNNIPDIITRWDRELKLIFANPALEDKTGVPNQSLYGKLHIEMLQFEHIAILSRSNVQKVLNAGTPIEYYNSFPTPDGEAHYFFRIVPERNIKGEIETALAIARDVTELKKAEEQFSLFIKASSDVIYKMSADWSEMFHLVSKKFLADWEPTDVNWFEKYIPLHEKERVTEAIQKAVDTKSVFDLEHEVIQADGTVGWTHSKAIPLIDKNGKILEWFGAATDITARKKAELEVRRSQELLHATINSSVDRIHVLVAVRNEKGEIIDFRWLLTNETSIRKYGDLAGQYMLEKHPGAIKAGIFDAFKQVVETGVTQSYEKHYTYEGLDNWIRQSIVKLDDGVVSTVTDITEHKKAEQELFKAKEELAQRATRKYLELFHSIDQGFCTIKVEYDENDKPVDYLFLEVSPSFEHHTGIKEGVGKWMRDIAPNHEEFWFETYGRIAKDRKAEQFEYFSTPLGRWWSVYAFPIDDPDSRRLGVLFNDITEQVKAKKKIEESEIQFRNVLLQSPNIFVILKGFPEMIITFANEPLFKSWGRTKEIIGKPLLEVLPELKDQPFPKLMQRVFETGETYHSSEEKAVIIKNGVPVDTYYRYVYQAIFDDDRKVTGVTIMATDITEQVTARKRIEESEKRFSNLLMESPFAFAILKGEDLVVALANDAIKRIWGKGNEIEGRPLLSLMPEIKTQGFAALLENVLSTGQPFYGHEEMVKIQRNGIWEEVYFNFIYQPYKEADEIISGVTIIANEVTTQAIANKKIAASEQNVRKLFKQAPAIICVHRGPQHVFELSNDVHQQLIGHRDILGKPVREAMPEVEGSGFYEFLDQVYATGEPFIGNEIPTKVDTGAGKLEERYFNFVYQPVHDGDGEINGIFVHGVDVTEQVLSRMKIEESEKEQAFLLNFSDTLRAEMTVDALAIRALRMLSEHLKLDRCYIGVYQLAEDRGVFPYQVGSDLVPPMPASVRLSDFPNAMQVAFHQTLVINDLTKAEGLADTDKKNIGALGLNAFVAATLRNGEANPSWSIVAISASPRQWTSSEIKLIEEVAERTWAAVERAKAEQALKQSEEKYRTIFETIDEGFTIQELLTDEDGNVTDLIYREVNEAYAQHSGIRDAIDKKASELFPHLEQHWLDNMSHVYKTGEPVRIEGYQSDVNRWFTLQYSRVGGPGSRFISAVFNDITEHKVEQERKEYLLKLSDALKELTNPIEIQLTACRILGEHLKVNRVLYAEVVDEELLIVNNNYVNGVAPIIATLNAGQFGKNVIDAFKRNEKVITGDINTDSQYDEDAKRSFLSLDVVANVGIGLVKGGKWVATFGMHCNAPRKWTPTEIWMLEETAERTWAALERGKALEALQRSEERLRFALDTAELGTFLWYPQEDRTEIDARMRTLLGMGELDTITLAEALSTMIHPDDRESYADAIAKAISPDGEGKLDLDYRIFYPDGTLHWLHIYGHTFFSNEPAPEATLMYGMVLDITDRKRREAHLEFLAGINLDFALLLTVPQVMEHVGEALASYLQLSRCVFSLVDEEKDHIEIIYEYRDEKTSPTIAGVRRLSESLAEEGRRHLRAGQPAVSDNASETPQMWIYTLNHAALESQIDVPHIEAGRWKFLLTLGRTKAGKWRSDEVELLQELASKIYIRIKRARDEEALRQSEANLSAMLQAIPVGLGFVDTTGIMLFSNEEMKRYLPTNILPSRDEERHSRWVGYDSEGNQVDRNNFPGARALRGEYVVPGIEMTYMQDNGIQIWTRVSGVPVKDQTGAIIGQVSAVTDINQLKQAEGELRKFNESLERLVQDRTFELKENKDLLQSVIDTSLIGMCVLKAVRNPSGLIRDFEIKMTNKELDRQTKREDLVGKLYAEEYPGIKEAGLFDCMLRVMETGIPEGLEFFYPYEGFDNWFSSMFIKLDDGLVATNLDISKRKKAETEVLKTLNLLKQAEDVADMGSWEYEISTGNFNWSEGMYKLFELPLGTRVTPEKYLDYAFDTSKEIAERIVDNIKNKFIPFEETVEVKVRGRIKFLRVKGTLVSDEHGKPLKMLGVDMDVTAAVEAEAKIRESEKLLTKVLDSIPQIAWTVSKANEITYFNKRWFEYSGLTFEQSVNGGWLDLIHPEQKEPLLKKWRDCFNNNTTFTSQYLLKNAEGEYRWHLARMISMGNESDEVHMWIGTLTDIHEQVIADDKLKQQEILQQQQKLNIILQAEERERKRISEGLHNGVGQLLYGTSLFLGQIKVEKEPVNVKQATEAKKKVESLLLESIRQIRNISHELVPLTIENFGLEQAIKGFCANFNTEDFSLNCEVYDFDISLDKYIELAIYRISQELLNNIVRHAKASKALIELSSRTDVIYLEVRDNGKGFDPDKVLKKGIGLDSIKERVDLLDGEMEISSTPGKGTAIRIKIPLKSQN